MQSIRRLPIVLVLWLGGILSAAGATPPAFTWRGYYITFMRMPTYGLEEWQRAIDLVRRDGGNLLVLWTAGGFRSQAFPETWAYNAEHRNVRHDFLRALIDYAHTKGIRVVLGCTPFGYDGANQMPLARPAWRATGPDGNPTAKFGIHSWGYNLCPALPETQEFMLDYVREMLFDFYPNADGLLIESSDYAICHCPRCGSNYFDREFQFVRTISTEIWERNKSAVVIVYPHYFTGAKVPFANATAAQQPFDPRWTMFFTPHSAAVDADLVKRAAGSIWSDDSPALRTPAEIAANARRARDSRCSGYIPSLEAFSYVSTEAEEGQAYLVGRRQVPFGFGWLKERQMPYDELPIRINRLAYREYSRDPDLAEENFRAVLGQELFGAAATNESIDDALRLQRAFTTDRTWSQAAPAVSPGRVQAMSETGQFSPARRQSLRELLAEIAAIERRYRDKGPAFAEMQHIAGWIGQQWNAQRHLLLEP